MFGYIRPYKPELKIKEFGIYKAVYCGLCHSLDRRYGFLSRMILSYDAAFMSILQLSLKSGCAGFEQKRCPSHPFKKCDCSLPASELDYWADASVILWYYKVLDNIKDSGFFKKSAAIFMLPAASLLFRKAEKLNPFVAKCSGEYIKAQSETEKSRCKNIDKAAHPTAFLMSNLLKNGAEGDECRILERMGYFLGRWIYFADAADDLSDDMKSGSYNPFTVSFDFSSETSINERKKAVEPMLNSCIFEISAAFELLKIKKFAPIISNIIYLGLPEMKKAVFSELYGKERKKRFAAIYRI